GMTNSRSPRSRAGRTTSIAQYRRYLTSRIALVTNRWCMTTVGKFVLGMMGRLRPVPATGDSAPTIALPPVERHGGMPLMEALAARRSSREFSADPLPLPRLADLLWAGFGVNRPDGGRTAPTALNAQEIDVYVALPTGAYRYDAAQNM